MKNQTKLLSGAPSISVEQAVKNAQEDRKHSSGSLKPKVPNLYRVLQDALDGKR